MSEGVASRRMPRQARLDAPGTLLRKVGEREGLDEEELSKVTRTREVVRVIKVFCQPAVRKYGHTGASVARFLGVATSLVNRYVASGGLLKFGRYT
jgi:hypothetical protein